jgi:hypothetical protein
MDDDNCLVVGCTRGVVVYKTFSFSIIRSNGERRSGVLMAEV